jgi:hypothetical protein
MVLFQKIKSVSEPKNLIDSTILFGLIQITFGQYPYKLVFSTEAGKYEMRISFIGEIYLQI